jgi:hypothetical protein
MRVLLLLSEFQKILRQMKISWGLMWQLDLATRPIFTGLYALDIYIVRSCDMRSFAQAILKSNPKLKKLSIAYDGGLCRDSPPKSLVLAMVEEAVAFPELQELTLFSFPISDKQAYVWHQVIPLGNLRRFTSFCGQDPFKTFARLDEHNSYDALNLQHLAIEVYSSREKPFMSMLRSCKPLTSLHVRFRKNVILNSFLQALRTHGSSLWTLAIDYCTSRDNETDTFHQSDFDELCSFAPMYTS